MLRNTYAEQKIIFPKTIANMNYLDVIITIFFYEELAIFRYGLESSSFGNLVPKILNHNYLHEFTACINEFLKLREKDKEKENKTPIPKTRSSLRKIFVSEKKKEGSVYDYKSQDTFQTCSQCYRMVKVGASEKVDEFLEKLTIFTYNN